MGDRMHIRKLQTILGSGRSSKPATPGCEAYRSDGVVPLQLWWWFGSTRRVINSLRFPFRPWYTEKEEPSFADMLTTLRRVSYEEKTPQLLPEQSGLKTWIAQLTELLSRTG